MDKEENKELNHFIENVIENFSPCEIILFGSRAKGNSWEHSDYDFIIVSDSFEGISWLARISQLVKYWNLEQDVDLIPYTSKEFEYKKKNFSFIREVLEKSQILT